LPPGNWFVRTEKVSLKYGKHGAGPYNNLRDIIESLVSSLPGHDCFNPEDRSLKIYLLPWIDMSLEKEFRVFVYNNEITAISSQNIYKVNNWLNSMTNNQIEGTVKDLIAFFHENVRDKLTYLNSYVMDIVLLEAGNFYFIEPNTFGKSYSSGSALFQWINDHDELHDPNHVELRYTSFDLNN
jgi:hypothetical protein